MAALDEKMQKEVLKYEVFINETLRGDLKNVLKQREDIQSEIGDYIQLQNTISKLESDSRKKASLKLKVDLGCNFYANASVPNYELIYVKAGLGLFIPLTLSEAKVFAEKRAALLGQLQTQLTHKASKIKATIKLVTKHLQELQGISDDLPPQRDIF